jgi:hypothetical protein
MRRPVLYNSSPRVKRAVQDAGYTGHFIRWVGRGKVGEEFVAIGADFSVEIRAKFDETHRSCSSPEFIDVKRRLPRLTGTSGS